MSCHPSTFSCFYLNRFIEAHMCVHKGQTAVGATRHCCYSAYFHTFQWLSMVDLCSLKTITWDIFWDSLSFKTLLFRLLFFFGGHFGKWGHFGSSSHLILWLSLELDWGVGELVGMVMIRSWVILFVFERWESKTEIPKYVYIGLMCYFFKTFCSFLTLSVN